MLSWFSDLNQRERRTMIACFGGWSLDAMDVMIFSFVIPSLLTLWHITKAEAGMLATVTLVVSALGGWFAGALADRFGRVRVLQVALLRCFIPSSLRSCRRQSPGKPCSGSASLQPFWSSGSDATSRNRRSAFTGLRRWAFLICLQR
jgi:MFS family permease